MFLPVLHAVPANFDVHRRGLSASVIIPLTIRDDGAVRVALDVRLWAGHWHGRAVHEFKFAIVVSDWVIGTETDIFDRHAAADYLGLVRSLVLPCVCAAAGPLIDALEPAVIYRCTYLSDPPANSLSKHQMITAALIQLDYDVLRDGLDGDGRRYWLMTRRGDG